MSRPGNPVVPASPRDETAATYSAYGLPTLTTTVLLTLFFGVFGAIPASNHANRARTFGLSGRRYWRAFWFTMLGQWVGAALLVGAFLGILYGNSVI